MLRCDPYFSTPIFAYLLSHPKAFAVGNAEHLSTIRTKIDVSSTQCAGQSTKMNNLQFVIAVRTDGNDIASLKKNHLRPPIHILRLTTLSYSIIFYRTTFF